MVLELNKYILKRNCVNHSQSRTVVWHLRALSGAHQSFAGGLVWHLRMFSRAHQSFTGGLAAMSLAPLSCVLMC